MMILQLHMLQLYSYSLPEQVQVAMSLKYNLSLPVSYSVITI